MSKSKPKASPAVKAAADRAQARSAGEDVDAEPRAAVDPIIDPAVREAIERAAAAALPVIHDPSGGRPSEYDPAFCQKVAELAVDGATDEEIAEELDVSVRTLYRWKARYPEFRQVINQAREIGDAEQTRRVRSSLYNRAVGYTFDAVKILSDKGTPVVVRYKEHLPPDASAAKHWLANRDAKNWARSAEDGGEAQTASAREVTMVEIARRLAYLLGQAMQAREAKPTAGSIIDGAAESGS